MCWFWYGILGTTVDGTTDEIARMDACREAILEKSIVAMNGDKKSWEKEKESLRGSVVYIPQKNLQ